MDYRKLAVDELKHINELRAAELVCRDRLQELNGQLSSFRMPSLQTDPVKGGGNKTEERWLSIISSQLDEERRLKNVCRRLKRFNTAWAVLNERDKAVLSEFYIEGGAGCADRVANALRCDVRTAFRWRDEALISFTRAFYGEVVA